MEIYDDPNFKKIFLRALLFLILLILLDLLAFWIIMSSPKEDTILNAEQKYTQQEIEYSYFKGFVDAVDKKNYDTSLAHFKNSYPIKNNH